MPYPERPLLRCIEMIPVEADRQRMYVLRDPEGLGHTVALHDGAALAALLMDGSRTLPEIRTAFREEVGGEIPEQELITIVRKLDHARLLAGAEFERHRRHCFDSYLKAKIRPAAHAGASYADDPTELRAELDAHFRDPEGPGPIEFPTANCPRLRGLLSPHIDIHRGGATYAWAYKRLAETCDADLFVILGTAHQAMQQWISVSRKDFDTPLGVVPTDQPYIERLVGHLHGSVFGRHLRPFDEELVQRREHSIEFQAVLLRYALPDRPLRIVPILVNSFFEFIEQKISPDESPEIQCLLAALRAAEAEHAGHVCYISAADLAHLGQRFGDEELLARRRLSAQAADDRKLLGHVCTGDANGFFDHVARQADRNRICGLAPTYLLLKTLEAAQGELLHYDQAVESDGTSCVSFAAAALQ